MFVCHEFFALGLLSILRSRSRFAFRGHSIHLRNSHKFRIKSSHPIRIIVFRHPVHLPFGAGSGLVHVIASYPLIDHKMKPFNNEHFVHLLFDCLRLLPDFCRVITSFCAYHISFLLFFSQIRTDSCRLPIRRKYDARLYVLYCHTETLRMFLRRRKSTFQSLHSFLSHFHSSLFTDISHSLHNSPSKFLSSISRWHTGHSRTYFIFFPPFPQTSEVPLSNANLP